MDNNYYLVLNGLLANGMEADYAIDEAKRIYKKVEGINVQPITPVVPVVPKPEIPIINPTPDENNCYYFIDKKYFASSDDLYLTVNCERSVKNGAINLVANGNVTQYAMIVSYPMHCLDGTRDEFVWVANKPDSGFYLCLGKIHKTFIGFNYRKSKLEIQTSDKVIVNSDEMMNVRAGDRLKMVILRGQLNIDVTIYNLSTNASVSMHYSYDMSNTQGAIAPDTYYRVIYFGENGRDDIDILSIRMCITKTKPEILFIGDSITAGYNGGSMRFTNLFPNALNNCVAGGPSDGVNNANLGASSYLKYMQPKNIIIGIGVNDHAGIDKDSYSNLVDMAFHTKANVKLMLMANDARDQTNDYNWMCMKYPSLVMQDVWNSTLKPGSTTGQVNPQYKSDANHFNMAGHSVIANAIKPYIKD
jgi:lysophospholipase L1-like esterase